MELDVVCAKFDEGHWHLVVPGVVSVLVRGQLDVQLDVVHVVFVLSDSIRRLRLGYTTAFRNLYVQTHINLTLSL